MNASEKSTRRTFLREGGAATLATAIPLFVPRHVLGSPTTPGASGQIVLGIVGMGQRGNQLLEYRPFDQSADVSHQNTSAMPAASTG